MGEGKMQAAVRNMFYRPVGYLQSTCVIPEMSLEYNRTCHLRLSLLPSKNGLKCQVYPGPGTGLPASHAHQTCP